MEGSTVPLLLLFLIGLCVNVSLPQWKKDWAVRQMRRRQSYRPKFRKFPLDPKIEKGLDQVRKEKSGLYERMSDDTPVNVRPREFADVMAAYSNDEILKELYTDIYGWMFTGKQNN